MSDEGKDGIDESRKVTYEVVLHVSDESDVYDTERARAAVERMLTEGEKGFWTGRAFWAGWEIISVQEVPVSARWRQVQQRDVSGRNAQPAAWEALDGALRVEQHPHSLDKFMPIVTVDGQRGTPGIFPDLETAQREAETAFRNQKGS